MVGVSSRGNVSMRSYLIWGLALVMFGFVVWLLPNSVWAQFFSGGIFIGHGVGLVVFAVGKR